MESRVTVSSASFLSIFSFLRPSALDLGSDRQTDRRTDSRRSSMLNVPTYGGGAWQYDFQPIAVDSLGPISESADSFLYNLDQRTVASIPLAAVAQIPILPPHSFRHAFFLFIFLSSPLPLPFPHSRSLSCLMGPVGTAPEKLAN